MIFSYDLKKRPETPYIYIAKPNKKILRSLNGIVTAKLTTNLLDIWQISFEVDKYLTDTIGSRKKNPSYDKIVHLMEISVDNMGWFRIDSYPDEQCSNGRWYKTFTAYGYETTLQDMDIVGININCGTEDSVEMFEENLDVFGVPKRNIKCYIQNANDDPTSDSYWKLGTLNIIEHEYLNKKGWSIGEVDIAVASLRGRQFEIDNQNVYSFLTQDFAASYKCLVIFDRINQKINIIKYENLGKDMNLEFNLRNVINDIEITDQKEKYYTRFRVVGNDPDAALLEYINYGSDKLENLDYCLQSGMLDDATAEKYRNYKEFVETHRQEYADYSLSFLKLQEEKTVYEEMLPIDEVDMLFTNVSNEELQTELEHFNTILTTLEEIYGTVEKMQGTTDYSMYISVCDVMIPKIQAEIIARENGTHAEKDAVDYETNWELYGINELKSRLAAYDRQVDVLKEKHYDQPWSSELGGNEDAHNKQYNLYLTYIGYIEAIEKRLTELQAKVDAIDVAISENNANQKALASRAKLEAEEWGFTASELSDIYMLYRDTDFEDSTIEILDTDSIDDVIALAWQLYDSAFKQMEIESHPQLSYSISLDNLFHIPTFSQKANNINLGDFCFLELDEGFKTKQRVIRMELELVNFNDMNLEIEFSDMTTVCGKADDYRFLLESNNSSSKNKITRSTATYIAQQVNSAALKILNKYYGSSCGSVFPNGVSQEDVQKLLDALDGLIDSNLSLNELKAKLAQIDTLEADSAFVKYLKTNYLVGNQASFIELQTKLAAVDNLLAGNISAELGHLIHLTADNVAIDEAVIKQVIAAQILVSDLQAGDITLSDHMRILSENGCMAMNGETLQIIGTASDGSQYVAIQLGYDTENNPSLIIRDENGATMLDGSGLHENIVPDGLIKNEMISNGTIQKAKLGFQIVEANEFGGIDITQVYDGQGGLWGIQYNQFKQSTENSLSVLNSSIKSIELTGEQIFKEDNGLVSPATITISAICKGGVSVSKWYIDDVPNTSFVSASGDSITIPYTYMGAKKTIAVKAEDTTGEHFDIMSVYMVSNGENAVTVVIQSSEGYLFKEDTPIESTKYTCTVYRGLVEIDPIAYEWKAISDDGTEWITIGTSKSVIVTMDSFLLRKRVKCVVDVDGPIPEPEEDTITAITDVEIEEIMNAVFGGGDG